jgi:hypothetical protein
MIVKIYCSSNKPTYYLTTYSSDETQDNTIQWELQFGIPNLHTSISVEGRDGPRDVAFVVRICRKNFADEKLFQFLSSATGKSGLG